MSDEAPETEQHQAFLELVHDFYRSVGSELPYFESEPDSPIAFEVHVDDVTFSVGYDPSQSVEKLFVYCRFGAIPEHDTVQVLQRLLQVNLSLAWQLRATLGVDAETNEVVYLFSEAVGAVDAQSLRDAMVRVAEQARRWRKTYFLDEAEALAQSDMTQGAWMPGILA